MNIFESASLGGCILKNRIIRSATFEGMCDTEGFPRPGYISHYHHLARSGVGGIITGFAYISKDGRAMHPGQAGIDSNQKIPSYRKMTELVHQNDCKIFMQIAHAGRQTRQSVTNEEVKGCTTKKSFYFGGKPRPLSTEEIYPVIEKFGDAACFARAAGFDGIQVHAAHGYLVHQFILRSINHREDEFGIDERTGIGSRFLDLIIDNIREKCGPDFPILVKVSGSDDYRDRFSTDQFTHLMIFLNRKKVDGIEISYGTMDFALNIFRGGFPSELILLKNPVYKSTGLLDRMIKKGLIFPLIKMKLKAFSPMYNIHYAILAKKYCRMPVITVGGFLSGDEIQFAISEKKIDFVGLCRAFIAEPDFIKKIEATIHYKSRCIQCNRCAVMCDSEKETRCYHK